MENNRHIKIFIAIPSSGSIKDKTVYSLAKLILSTNVEMDFSIQTSCDLVANRNYLVLQAQSQLTSHILFIDSDMVFEADMLTKLLAHHKEIIGVVANYKRLPLRSAIKVLAEDGSNGGTPDSIPTELFKCYALGGIFLVDMEVFMKIDQPWFKFEHEGPICKTGEDVWFCEQAHKKGIEVWCDPTIKVKHLGDYEY